MLEKNYNPSAEEELYRKWEENGYFRARVNAEKTPFSVVIPPPNITGILHMGHAFNNTIQDVLIRAKRMQGYETLWQPGTDHAAIATEVRIIKSLAEQGISKNEIGREEFLKKAWEWNEQYGGTIIQQLKRMGFSCDWERTRFTMDEGLSDAVLEVFVSLHKDGKIYRGEKLINWCTKCGTTISDAEVEHIDSNSGFYHFKYPIIGTDEFLAFATTRPETMLGDTAIAVNPADERYTKFVGKSVKVPFVDREIPIIADEYVEKDFGTGVVKITPAHDPNDFEVGERHNLPIINIMNDDGTLNANAADYAGLTVQAARDRIIREMDELGLFIKQEQIQNNVGVHDRCGEVIQPLIKLQWFVKMQELAQPAINAYKSGELRFNRPRYGKIYLHWLENIKDWCISRQLWWGHRIPAYYCESCNHMIIEKEQPDICPQCKSSRFRQDNDTLDTWFSSALWTFATLGWPKKTADLEYFFPTNLLVTADEIIFFWVVRMVFSSYYFMGENPFKDVIIHGKILDEHGRKMSKSLGNGTDPMDVIEKYGADALRLMLVSGNALDSDSRFSWDRIEPIRNFLNKVWNASRFLLMQFENSEISENEKSQNLGNLETSENIENSENSQKIPKLRTEDKWILSQANLLVAEVTAKLDEYELGFATQAIIDFFWNEFCDWYVEMVKPRLYDKEGDSDKAAALWTLRHVLTVSLKLLHPFTPFITEEIFLKLQSTEPTIMLSEYPKYAANFSFPKESANIAKIQEAVRAIRNLRAEKQVAPSKKIKIAVVAEEQAVVDIFTESLSFFSSLAGAEDVKITLAKSGGEILENAVSLVISGAVLYIPLDTLINFAEERTRLDKERKKLQQELARVEGKLANEGFLKKAPENLINAEKEKLEKYREMLGKVEEQILGLGG